MSRYRFYVHSRWPAFRLVVAADAPMPPEAKAADWTFTRERAAEDTNADVRQAVDATGYCLFKIGFDFSELPDEP